MKQRLIIGLALGISASLVATPAVAKRHYVEGEVIKVQLQQQVETRNRGDLNELTIRTREGQELRLLLGAGPCPFCPQVGDRVRARLMRQVQAGEGPEVCDVRTLRNLTRRERLRVRDRSGDLVMTRTRTRLQDGRRGGRAQGSGRRGGGTRRGKG